jgi:hypothetical protein
VLETNQREDVIGKKKVQQGNGRQATSSAQMEYHKHDEQRGKKELNSTNKYAYLELARVLAFGFSRRSLNRDCQKYRSMRFLNSCDLIANVLAGQVDFWTYVGFCECNFCFYQFWLPGL